MFAYSVVYRFSANSYPMLLTRATADFTQEGTYWQVLPKISSLIKRLSCIFMSLTFYYTPMSTAVLTEAVLAELGTPLRSALLHIQKSQQSLPI
jgi:hypothetical protein